MQQGIELFIGGNFSGLAKAITGAEKAVENFAQSSTAANQQAANASLAAHVEAGKRRIVALEAETRALKGELDRQLALSVELQNKVLAAEKTAAAYGTRAKAEELAKQRAAVIRNADEIRTKLVENQRRTERELTEVAAQEARRREAQTAKASRVSPGAAGASALAGAAISAGLSVSVKNAVQTFGEFQATLNQVRAVSSATELQMAALTAQALELGAKTKYSAGEAAAGMAELAKAGFSAEATMRAIPGVLSLAAAGGVSVAQAAEVASATLNGFGLAASDAGKVADILAKAANLSAIGIGDLQYSMKYIAPVAASASQSLEEMATAMVVMGNQGIKGEQAGTTLRAAIIRLQKPPKEAAEALTALGVSIQDTSGKMLPLSGIIDQVRTKTAQMTEVKRNETVSNIFGTEALSGMLALMNQTPKAYAEASAAVRDYSGAAKAMADVMNSGVLASFEQLQGSAETLAIIFGRQFEPALRQVLSGAISLGDALGQMPKEFWAVNAGVAAAVIAAGGFATALAGLATAGALVGPAMAGLTVALGAMGLTVGPVVAGVGALSLALGGTVTYLALAGEGTKVLTDAQISARASVSRLAEQYDALAQKTGRTAAENEALARLQDQLKAQAPELLSATRNHTGAIELNRVALVARNAEIAKEIELNKQAAAAQLLKMRQDVAAANIRSQDLRAQLREVEKGINTFSAVGVINPDRLGVAGNHLANLNARRSELLAQLQANEAAKNEAQSAYDLRRFGRNSEAMGPVLPRTAGPAVGTLGGETEAQIRARLKREERARAAAARSAAAHQRALSRGGALNMSDFTVGRHTTPAGGQRQGAPRSYGPHAGEDYAWGTDVGAPVYSAVGGTVRSVTSLGRAGGLKVAIETATGAIEEYLHLANVAVQVGQRLQAGEKIAQIANLGQQSHLHFQVKRGGRTLNVREYARQVAMQRFGTTNPGEVRQMVRSSAPTLNPLAEAEAEALEALQRAQAQRNRPQEAGGLLGSRPRAGMSVSTPEKVGGNSGIFKEWIDSAELRQYVGTIEEATDGSEALAGAISDIGSALTSIAMDGSAENIARQFQALTGNPERVRSFGVALEKLQDAFTKGGGGSSGLGSVMLSLAGSIDPLTVSLQALGLVLPQIVGGFDQFLNGPASLRAINEELRTSIDLLESRAEFGLASAGEVMQGRADAATRATESAAARLAALGGSTGAAADAALIKAGASDPGRAYGNPDFVAALYRQRERDSLRALIAEKKAEADAAKAKIKAAEEVAAADAKYWDEAQSREQRKRDAGREALDTAREARAEAEREAGTAAKVALTEEEIAALGREIANLSGEALDNRVKLLSTEFQISEQMLRQSAALAKQNQIKDWQAESADIAAELKDVQAERLDIERQITELVTRQADEAERIRGESIAVRAETEAQYKARKLAELEAEKASGLANLAPRYEALKSQEMGLIGRQANLAISLQDAKGDAGNSTQQDIRRRLAEALAMLAGLPKYHSGGTVPGASTTESLAILRGGEVVLTPEQVKAAAKNAMTGAAYAGPGMLAALRAGAANNYVTIQAGIVGDEEKLTRHMLQGLESFARRSGIRS